MKSRISIDLDENNSPYISIQYSPSDDVRDKMVKRFLEGFGSESTLAKFSFTNYSNDSVTHASIHPIPWWNLGEECKVTQLWLNSLPKTEEEKINSAPTQSPNNLNEQLR